MGGLAVFLLILCFTVRSTGASFCLCKKGSDDALQNVLDYACSNGADCGPIKPDGACYNPNNVRDHCSYAVNSYYANKAAQGATCDFRGAAYLSNTNPSSNGCTYPGGASSPGSSTTPTTPGSSTTPTSPGSSSTPTTPVYSMSPPGTSTGSPYGTSSPSTGILGGVGSGMAPSGTDFNNDMNRAHRRLYCSSILPALLMAAFSCYYVSLWI